MEGLRRLEQREVPHSFNVEEVLFDLHAGNEIDTERAHHLHEEVASCELFALYESYENGKIPTLARLFDGLEELLEAAEREVVQIEGEYGPTVAADGRRLITLLSGRKQQVTWWISEYVESVIRHENLKRLSAGGSRDLTDQFVRADQQRRRAHDALMESLRVYQDTLTKATEEGLFAEISDDQDVLYSEWREPVDARLLEGKVLVFSPDMLTHENRNVIRDWAIATDFAERLREIDSRIEQQEKEKAAPH